MDQDVGPRLHGQRVDTEEAAVVDLMKAVAQGNSEEEELTAWLDAHAGSTGAP